MTNDQSRAEFEKWVSSPPIEAPVDRQSSDPEKAAFPGHYYLYAVQLAWEAWQEAGRQNVKVSDE